MDYTFLKIKEKNTHYTFSHYNENGEKQYKSKKCYATQEEAIVMARKLNLSPQTVHKYSAYKCSICHKWHVGKNKYKTITEEDREKIRKQIETENFYKKASYGKHIRITEKIS